MLPLILALAAAGVFAADNPVARDPAAAAAGQKLFASVCSGCHGATGEGGRGPNLNEGRSLRRMDDQQLFDSIKKGVPGTDMPPFPLPDDQVWRLVTYVRRLSAPAFEAGMPGDAAAGEALFFGKAGCANCHAVRGRGGLLGPDLTNAGMARSANFLREALLKPGARIAQGYESVKAALRDGRVIEGVARNRTNYSIQLVDRQGKLHLIDMAQVQELSIERDSRMPADYGRRLTKAEIDNLLAYVAAQAIRPGAAR